MKKLLRYNNKSVVIEPYTTKTEKDLMVLALSESCTLTDAMLTCGYSKELVETLNRREMIGLLFKIRAMSIGEEINIKFKCKHCNKSSDTKINIDNLMTISPNYEDDHEINDAFINVLPSTINEFMDIDVDELDLDELDTVLERIKRHAVVFDFMKIYKCEYCFKDNLIPLEFMTDQKLIQYLSDSTANQLYKDYNSLVYYTKYSKLDIDSMYPFEREILTGLLNNTIEEENRKK